MGLTFKEIAIDNWDTYLYICADLIDVIIEMFTDAIPDIFFSLFVETTVDMTYCLNIFGKIFAWCSIGVIIFIISLALILTILCIVVLCIILLILYAIIGIILYLPSILIRWIYQRTLKPFFRMVFIKKECKNNI